MSGFSYADAGKHIMIARNLLLIAVSRCSLFLLEFAHLM